VLDYGVGRLGYAEVLAEGAMKVTSDVPDRVNRTAGEEMIEGLLLDGIDGKRARVAVKR
jgi:hypothetical protein